MNYIRIGMVSLMMAMLSACNLPPPVPNASIDVETYYKSSPKPPVGQSRVYIIPSKAINWLLDSKPMSWYYLGRNQSDFRETKALPYLGLVKSDLFLAFDAPPGQLTLTTRSQLGSAAVATFNLPQNGAIVIQNLIYNNGAGLGLIGAVINANDASARPPFVITTYNDNAAAIQALNLAGLAPTAPSYLKQEASIIASEGNSPVLQTTIPQQSMKEREPEQIPPPAPAVEKAISPTVSPTVNQPAVQQQTSVEKSLEDLKRLFDRGLITKPEYDAKRKEILGGFADAYQLGTSPTSEGVEEFFHSFFYARSNWV